MCRVHNILTVQEGEKLRVRLSKELVPCANLSWHLTWPIAGQFGEPFRAF